MIKPRLWKAACDVAAAFPVVSKSIPANFNGFVVAHRLQYPGWAASPWSLQRTQQRLLLLMVFSPTERKTSLFWRVPTGGGREGMEGRCYITLFSCNVIITCVWNLLLHRFFQYFLQVFAWSPTLNIGWQDGNSILAKNITHNILLEWGFKMPLIFYIWQWTKLFVCWINGALMRHQIYLCH